MENSVVIGGGPLLIFGLGQLENLPEAFWSDTAMGKQQANCLVLFLETVVSTVPTAAAIGSAATIYLRAARHSTREKRFLGSAAKLLQVTDVAASFVCYEGPLDYVCAVAELYKESAANVKKTSVLQYMESLLSFGIAVHKAFSMPAMLTLSYSGWGPCTAPSALMDIITSLIFLEKRRQAAYKHAFVDMMNMAVTFAMMSVPDILAVRSQRVMLSQAMSEYFSLLASSESGLSKTMCFSQLEVWTSTSNKCGQQITAVEQESGWIDPEILFCVAKPLTIIYDMLTKDFARLEEEPHSLNTSLAIQRASILTNSLSARVGLWRILMIWRVQGRFQGDVVNGSNIPNRAATEASLHEIAPHLIDGIATLLRLQIKSARVEWVNSIHFSVMEAMEVLEEWSEDGPGILPPQLFSKIGHAVAAVLRDTLMVLRSGGLHRLNAGFTNLSRVVARTALMLLKQVTKYHRVLEGRDFSALMCITAASLCVVLSDSYDEVAIDGLATEGAVQALWSFLVKVGPTAGQRAVDDIVPPVCRALMIISAQLPCFVSRLLAPGCECDWGTATVAVRAASFNSTITETAANLACAKFAQQLDELLKRCRCWQMKTGSGPSQCRNRLFEKVLRAQATPKPSTAVVADPTAVAEATKKADAAMEALLLEEAVQQSAVTAKAAKKARRRASKAAATKASVQPSLPANSSAAATSELPAESNPLAATTPADNSSSRYRLSDTEPSPVSPTCAPERDPNALPSWMRCPITQGMLIDPVVCTDGFSYERAAIDSWLEIHDTSFVTGETLSSKFLVPNRALKNRLQELGLMT